ncbi:hypothetical protein FLAN108750_03365 [Flavobacterium antarcticum]|uniref:hypothetical protein n=1 Tax=Flavobacterium antarcticum TaxID=271155 RepID=UPI0003B4DC14|nr:hypothetical protein [Flavobacterium antarcticum]
MNKNIKKFGLILVGIMAVVAVVSIGVNWWIDVKLPQLISDKNETPYHIKYQELEISLFSKTIEARGITIIPKEREKDSLSKNGIFATVERVTIDNFALFPLLFSNKIEAQTITVRGPKVTLFKDNDKTINSSKSVGSRVVKPFQQLIKVADINLEQGNFSIINLKNNKTLFSAQNVTVQLDDIAISDETLQQKIPFTYKKYAFSCDSLFYQTDDLYHIKSDKINTTNTGLEINNFSMISMFNRRQFVNQLPKEKDLYTLKAEKIAVKNMDWGFKKEVLFFKTNQILIEQANANIYRSKMPEDDLSVKPLYNKLLRELPFELQVDTLTVANSKLVYEEEKSFDKGPGILEFSSFNLQATHLNSGYQKTKLPDVVIAIDCKFMKRSPMKIDWRFNVMDQSDGFKIKGRILNFETGRLAVFTKPYLNATTKGTLDQVYFNFAGNNNTAGGDFALKYHDLKVKLYQKKNRDKESKLKTWIGNLLLKDDSDGVLIENEVSVERIKEKSFYNYFWLCIADGMKKTLI